MKQTTKLQKSFYNGISNFVGVAATAILGLIIPRLVLVNYGSETNGLINSVNQIVVYLALFEAGIGTTAMQALYKPVADNDHGEINSVLSALNKNYQKVGILYFCFLVLLSAVYPIFILKSETSFNYLEIFLIVLFSGLGNVILFFCQGKYRIFLQVEGKTYIMTNLQTVITILISFTKIILLLNGLNIVSVIVSTFTLNLIQVFYIIILIKRKYKWIDLKTPPSKLALSKKKYVFIHQIAWMIFQNTDVLILTVFCDLKIVSVYSMYKLVITNLQSLLNIPYDAVSFMLGQAFNKDLEDFKKKIDCIEVYHSALVFTVFSVTICLFTPFIAIYTRGVTDINYIDKYIPILFVLIELLIFARKPMLSTINYAGHFKETLTATIIEAVLNLTVSILGVIYFGIYGVLLGTVAALIYRTIDILIYSNTKLLKRSPIKNIFMYIMDFLIAFIIYTLYSRFSFNIPSYFTFAVYGIVLVIISGALYFGIHSIIYRNEFKYIIKLLKQRLKIKFSIK